MRNAHAAAVGGIDATQAWAHTRPDMATRKKLLREKIQVACGILKRKPGGKPFAEEWAEHKRAERELEEAKFARCASSASVLPPRG